MDELIREHAGLVAAVVAAHLPDRGEAEDVTQEAFLIACREFGRLRRRESFGPWIATIARHLAIAARSAVRRRREVSGLPAEREAPAPAAVDRAALSRRVLAEVERLPDGLREVFLLRYVEGRSCAAVAEALDVPIGTVTSRLSRGHELLRERLSPEVQP